jgi:hypothetical protein
MLKILKVVRNLECNNPDAHKKQSTSNLVDCFSNYTIVSARPCE